jgi:uncharacterized protein YbjT (DUF2867 family)
MRILIVGATGTIGKAVVQAMSIHNAQSQMKG